MEKEEWKERKNQEEEEFIISVRGYGGVARYKIDYAGMDDIEAILEDRGERVDL